MHDLDVMSISGTLNPHDVLWSESARAREMKETTELDNNLERF